VIILKKKNHYLAKHDDFVVANYDFNLETQRLFFACLYKMNSSYVKPIENQLSFIYELDFEEIKRLIGIDYAIENHEQVMKRAEKDLVEKVVEIKTKTSSVITGIVKSFRVNEVDKTVIVEIDKEIKPFLVDTFKKFTKFGFRHLALCQSKYSFRLYEILITKSKNIEENKKIVKLSVDEFKNILKIPESYDFSRIRERVLDKAKVEYNATDISDEQEREEKKLFKSFDYQEVVTRQRGKGRNPVTDIIFEFELLEETKLLMMSKIEKIKTELKSDDWIMLTIRELIEKNKEREPFFQTLEINYINGYITQAIENIKKEYGIYGNLNQNLIKITLENAFTKFIKNKNNNFEAFLLNGFRLNCNFFIEKNKNLVE
jgi:hypothetical protein